MREIQNEKGDDMNTWKDVLAYLQGMTEEQLKQSPMLLPQQFDGDKPTHLQPIIAMGTVEEMCHVDGEIVTETRGSDDFKHHPEQIVMLYDLSPYDEDGNTCYELVEGGFIGNVTGKLYSYPPGDKGEDDE